MSETGLILGKFYPPHAGHHFLIDTALSECQRVIVLIMVNDVEKDSLPGPIRVNMIQSAHAEAFAEGRLHVYDTVNNINVDYTSREADKAHAQHVVGSLKRVDKLNLAPFKLYTSEEWGDRFAKDISELLYGRGNTSGVDHRMVDQKRIAKPISASKVRSDFVGNWHMLAPTTRAAMTRRVVICGGESTGTTTLARALAERYQTVWVPEYGRTFSESVGNHHVWTSDDFALLMEEQNRQEDLMAQYAGPVMFCDTDNLATRMFHELYLKSEGPDTRLYHEAERYTQRALYIVTDHVNVEFEDDGYRLFASQREWATRWFERMLDHLSLPWIKVTGSHAERMDQAIQKVDELLKWDFAAPIEYR